MSHNNCGVLKIFGPKPVSSSRSIISRKSAGAELEIEPGENVEVFLFKSICPHCLFCN